VHYFLKKVLCCKIHFFLLLYSHQAHGATQAVTGQGALNDGGGSSSAALAAVRSGVNGGRGAGVLFGGMPGSPTKKVRD
jgi:hypothetical protein